MKKFKPLQFSICILILALLGWGLPIIGKLLPN